MPGIEELALVGLIAIVGALLWVAYQVRRLHEDLQPLIESSIVQTIAAA